MMQRALNIVLTALAPMIWGSTYLITTEYLPQGYPITAAMLRALPIGIILMIVIRAFPPREWLLRIVLLGALNFSAFWWLLFVSAYRLPGGVAATIGAVQPLIVLYLSRHALGTKISPLAIVAAIAGIIGVGMLIISPQAALDPLGILAAFGGAISMAFGIVLTRKWQPPTSALTFTAWQLTAGGLLLLPAALAFEPALPPLTTANILGFSYLGLIGGGFTYFLWFRGISKLGPSATAPLGFFSPLTAVTLGWLILGQNLNIAQKIAVVIILTSVWLASIAAQKNR